ncbi:hypothetical protein N0V93_007006 [Gnomoniopsis smithogilvyi]|uniref:Promethin n=1 Tax=Gnomoniopsis smithogilvyi TaxID=1191159 RepID=A0A9W8YQS2_9PEZI|nr:hypothetical protein N0V93_007006 [Gnomoniopsis smithogilvyi]
MAVLDYVNGTLESARRQADRVVTPDSRQKAYDALWSFAQERPILSSFLAAQVLFSLLPLLLFASFAFGTVALAAISALLFSLFWIGVAALVLGGTLFVTSSLALLSWAWVVGAYLAASFAYGLVFAGGQTAGSKDEEEEQQQRLLSEKWARIVKIKSDSVDDGTTAVQEEVKVDGQDVTGEKEGVHGVL